MPLLDDVKLPTDTPPAPGTTAGERAPEALTTRGLVVGAVAAGALGLGCVYATMVLRGSYMDHDFSTPGALFILFVLVVLGRGVLRRIAPKLALTPAELTFSYVMLLMASAIPTLGFTAQIIPLITAPYYFATPENRWERLFWPYIPKWIAPHDPNVVKGLYEGWAKGAAVPWGQWLPPLLAWLPLIAALHFGMICVMVIFRRQWVEHERLPYPVVQLPLALATGYDSGSPKPFFRQVTTWIGFALPFVFGSLIGLHHYFPSVPAPRMEWTFPCFRQHNTLVLRISFPMLGFFYLVPLDTLFSLWSMNLIAFCASGVLNVLGLELNENLGVFSSSSPLLSHLGMGAMLALAISGLRVGRHHLENVWRKVWGQAPEVDDSQEIMSYRTAFFGLVACTLVMAVWLNASGLPFWLTFPFLLFAFVIFFGLTRIVSEMGIAEAGTAAIAPSQMTSTFGYGPIGPRGLMALSLAHIWTSENRTFVMASAANGLKLATEVRLRGRRLLVGMLVALAVAIVSSVWLTLRHAYLEGGTVLQWWFFRYNPRFVYGWAADTATNPPRPHVGGMGLAGAGAAMFLLFASLRQRFTWWPFHPAALAVAATWSMDQIWLMCLVAWLCKLLALRYGGLRTYRAARSVFLGLILGQFVTNGLWLFVDHFAGMRGNEIFWL